MINSITFTNPIKSIDCGFRFEIHQYFSFKSSFGRSFVRSLTLRKAFFMIICMVIRFALFAIEQIHLLLFCFFYFYSIPSIHHWLDDQLYCYLWICLFNSSWIFYAIFSKRFYTGIWIGGRFCYEIFDIRLSIRYAAICVIPLRLANRIEKHWLPSSNFVTISHWMVFLSVRFFHNWKK